MSYILRLLCLMSFMSYVFYLASYVFDLMSYVFCLSFNIFRLMSYVFCLSFDMFRLMSYVFCLASHVVRLIYVPSLLSMSPRIRKWLRNSIIILYLCTYF